MKQLFTFLLATLAWFSPTMADKKEAYAELTTGVEGSIFTFYFDEIRSQREGAGSSVDCLIKDPEGFNFGVDTSSGRFEWKGGEFSIEHQIPSGSLAYTALDNDGILTFYYDDKMESRSGSIHYLNYSIEYIDPDFYIPFRGKTTDHPEGVKKIVFDPSFAQATPTSTSNWFNGMTQLTDIVGMEYLNTSEVTNMAYMFRDCRNLESLDLSHFDTSNVDNSDDYLWENYEWEAHGMQYMFAGCSNLKSLNVSHFNTSSVGKMNNMFEGCSSLMSIDVSNFDTSLVRDMSDMFAGCSSLKSLDISHFETGSVYYLSIMAPGFSDYCYGFSGMFADCSSLEHLDVSNFHISKRENSLSNMFMNCSALKTVKLFSFDSLVTPEEDGSYDSCDFSTGGMFKNCSSLTEIDMSNINAVIDYAEDMFNGCINLKKIDISHLQIRVPLEEDEESSMPENIYSISRMFKDCKSLTELDLGHLNIPTEPVEYYDETTDDFYEVSPTSELLAGCSGLRKLTISSAMADLSDDACEGVGEDSACIIKAPDGFDYGVDTSDVWIEWKSGYFYIHPNGQIAYTSLSENGTLTFYYDQDEDLRSGKIFYLNYINYYPQQPELKERYTPFRGIASDDPESVKKAVFDSSFAKVTPTSTRSWFDGMKHLALIEGFEFLNTSEVKDMAFMFNNCSSLTNLDLSHFDTKNVIYDYDDGRDSRHDGFTGMFSGCSNLVYLDVSKFNISLANNLGNMFKDCARLKSVSLFSFGNRDIEDMTDDDDYLYNAVGLNTYGMFNGCNSLTEIDLSNIKAVINNSEDMFNGCTNLKQLDISNLRIKVTTPPEEGEPFIIPDNIIPTSISRMFKDCKSLTELDLGHLNIPTEPVEYYDETTDDYYEVSPTSELLAGCSGLRKLTISSEMADLDDDACEGVGTSDYPCSIFAPDGFDFQADTTGSWFLWKSGYFNLGAVGDLLQIADINIAQGWEIDVPVMMNNPQKYKHVEFNIVLPKDIFMNSIIDIEGDTIVLDEGNYWVLQVDTAYVLGLDTEKYDSGTPGKLCSFPLEAYSGLAPGTYIGKICNQVFTDYDGNKYRPVDTTFKINVTPSSTCDTYVVYANNTLTFYSDAMKEIRDGKIYHLNTDSIIPEWHEMKDSIYRVEFRQSFSYARPTSTYYWFMLNQELSEIDNLRFLNTSEVTNMMCMFYYCDRLYNLDVSTFDTRKVTNMNWMFYKVQAKELDLSNFNTSNVTEMRTMFGYCENLEKLDLSSFDTHNVKTMRSLFTHCYSLKQLDISSFDTENLENMHLMFEGCFSLTDLDLSHFNTSNVTNMNSMFYECRELTNLNLDNFNTCKVTDMYAMFAYCQSLKKIDLSSFDTSSAENISAMFYHCDGLEEIDISHFNTNNVTDMSLLFYQCENVKCLDLKNLIIEEGTKSDGLLYSCKNLSDLTISPSMKNLTDRSCELIGTEEKPCVIHAPVDFDFGVDTSGDYFVWKSGYFKLDVNSITGNMMTDNPDSPIYTINGMKTSRPTKGIYIRNGQKYVKK